MHRSVKHTIAGLALVAFLSLALAGSIATNESFPAEKQLALDIQPPQARQNPDKYAVVIGIVYDNYEFGVVNFADRDAAFVYDLLTQRLGYPEENVVLLQNSNASRENIISALQDLAGNPDIGPETEVTVYYSGHGIRSAPDIGLNIAAAEPGYALVPFDFMNYDFRNGAGLIWDRELAEILGRLNPGKMWIAIDSCNAGGFTRPGITGPNRVVTMSSRADQMSSEINETQRGVFTQYMVEDGLARGLSVEQAYENAVPRAAAGFGQTPQIADEYPGNLYLK